MEIQAAVLRNLVGTLSVEPIEIGTGGHLDVAAASNCCTPGSAGYGTGSAHRHSNGQPAVCDLDGRLEGVFSRSNVSRVPADSGGIPQGASANVALTMMNR